MSKVAIGKTRGTIWRSECGLLFSADMGWKANLLHFGTCYIGELEYSDELGKNPVRCPYGKRCEKSTLHSSLHPYWDCVAVLTNETYNYEASGDKIYLDYFEEYKKNCNEVALERSSGKTEGHGCYRFKHLGRGKAKFITGSVCMSRDCERGLCLLTLRERDMTQVHIYGEREGVSDLGTLVEHKVVVRGIKVTDHMIAKDFADKLIRQYESESEKEWHYHHNFPKPTKFYTSKRVIRDLRRDLTDTKGGIEVLHDSDLREAVAEVKREKRQLAKQKRTVNKNKMIVGSAQIFEQPTLF